MLNQTGDFNTEDFNALSNATESGAFENTQWVTHIDHVTDNQHVFFFNPMLSQEESDKPPTPPPKLTLVNNELDRFGLDYIANTTSIVTNCISITKECRMHNATDNEISVSYHCSDIFNGDLNEILKNGLERLKGWNTFFYDHQNGVPRNISIASS